LTSRWIPALAAASCFCAGLALSWPAAGMQAFVMLAFFWAAWMLVGFGPAIYRVGQPASRAPAAGRAFSWLLVGLAVVLAFTLGRSIFPPVPWIAATLLMLLGARAPLIRDRRGLYRCLGACVCCGLAVTAHESADLTLLFFVVPSWFFAAMSLAADYGAGRALAGSIRFTSAGLFFVCVAGLTAGLFQTLPLPPRWGWADETLAAQLPKVLEPVSSLLWDNILSSAGDRRPPPPQAKEPTSATSESRPVQALPMIETQVTWFWVYRKQLAILGLVFAALAALGWFRRHALLGRALATGAWLTARPCPLQSMRLSAAALRRQLRRHGHAAAREHSLREHLAGAGGLCEGAQQRFLAAVELYGEARFGVAGASTASARAMRRAVAEGAAALAASRRSHQSRPERQGSLLRPKRRRRSCP